jgi:pimeloyl-ACP methyl ester carboxylesterase
MANPIQSFDFEGHRVAYRVYGGGDRDLVLIHGLLMSSRMFDRFAPEMAASGNRVICIDLLGHGESDKPDDFGFYSMSSFAYQVAALLDHLGLEQSVIGGTSLGANVSLEMAVRHPDRIRGLFIEMPVLDNALAAVAVAFTPVMVAARFGEIPMGLIANLTRRIPRTHYLVDIGLDWLRRDPRTTAWVLQGLLLGRTCPPSAERRTITAPTFVVGHRADPVHPFSDSDALINEIEGAELVDANSILEWRLNPGRLNGELTRFLARVHEGPSLRAVAA